MFLYLWGIKKVSVVLIMAKSVASNNVTIIVVYFLIVLIEVTMLNFDITTQS